MSFANEARKVREQQRPYGARVNALCHCLELYCPLGFQLSLDYLQRYAGTFWRHRHAVPRAPETDAALLTAIRLIEESRNLQTAAAAVYATERAEQKARGRRSPHPRETTP